MGEPRWLEADQQQAWRRFSAVVQLLPSALEAPLQRKANLTYFSYLVMAMLSEAPDRTHRMSDLAALTNGSLSRLSHVVTRLERQGWVCRRPHPTDGRVTVAVLTDAGFDKVVSSAPVHVESVRDLVIDRLSAEQLDQLDDICTTLLASMPFEGRLTVFRTAGP